MSCHIAHLTYVKGRLAWSGYQASGDPNLGMGHRADKERRAKGLADTHPIAHRVDVGREFTIGEDSKLHFHADVDPPGGFSPSELLLSARCGYFGMSVEDGPGRRPVAPSSAAEARRSGREPGGPS